ncbi:hypothetical protein Vadar_002782 [Vaccinium darrowii]|uniref:Uncharacterized protein n=1 Tax=Vaccinium darrowii TaxID=229202 RepID=A0ACB7YKU9_9ERIC|nr:hypothetical protein Vadar_002782 [Vaccinium darrowii]
MLVVKNIKAPPSYVPPADSGSTRNVLHRHSTSILAITMATLYSSSTLLYKKITVVLDPAVKSVPRKFTEEIGFILVRDVITLSIYVALNNKRETEELDSTDLVTAPSDKVPTELDPTPINLPMRDDSVDIITQFIKNTRIQGKYKEVAEIKHSCHDHPLTYIDFEKTIDLAVSPSMSNLSSLLNGERN